MWLPVASAVTGVETDSSKATTDGQTLSNTTTSNAGENNKDMDAGNVSIAATVTDSLSSESKTWFTNPFMSDSMSGFVSCLPSESANKPANCVSLESANHQPELPSQQAKPEVPESINQSSNSMMSESVPAPTCEEKLSSVPEIDRELFWPRDFKLYIVNDNLKTNAARAKVVGEFFILN